MNESTPTLILPFKTTTNADGEAVELNLHIFNPPNHTANTPVILFFFGGGWQGGSADKFYPHSAYFAARGMVAIAADYRTFQQHQTSPFECVADAKSAVRYVRAHAAELGIDPNRIAAAGSSAGGHVAACAGILTHGDEPGEDAGISSRPDAMVLYNPVIDTSTAGYGHDKLGERWRELSPHHHVRPNLPPAIVFHGDADDVVPYANAVDFEAAMKEAGNRCTLVTLPGVGHGFVYNLKNPAAREAVEGTEGFLRELGYV